MSGAATGGAETPAPTCFGSPATIVGTGANDTIVGTAGPDVIVGLGGDDAIDGGGGNDKICGGDGNDSITGGNGDDSIDGGAGRDAISGGPGDDVIDGGADGPDSAFYLEATGPVHADLSTGVATGEGTDTLRSIDSLVGSQFGDMLIGDANSNALLGLGGNDTLDGGLSWDALLGGAGNDTLIGSPGDGDAAVFVLAPQSVTADLQSGVATGEGNDTLRGIDTLMGSTHSDTLRGDDRMNFLLGLGGNDQLEGRGGDDILYGEYPGEPNSTFGTPGSDRLDGGPGNDTLFGGPGADVLVGGPGTDDAASFANSAAGVHVDLGAGQAGGEGADRLSSVEDVIGSAFADRLVGDAKANALFGGDGNDTLAGGPGNDFLGGGNGSDTARGGPDRDYCLNDEHTSQCEITGAPPIVGTPEPPPGGSRRLVGSGAEVPAVVDEFHAMRTFLETGRAEPASAPTKEAAKTAVRATAPYEYSAEPVCISAKGGGLTEIAPPNVVDPVGNDGAPEEAWWQGTLVRGSPKAGGSHRVRAKTAWARAQLAGGGLPGGIVIWKDASGRRAFRSPVGFRVARGRYYWIGQIFWVRSGGKVFAPVEPHIIRAATIRHDKNCVFR